MPKRKDLVGIQFDELIVIEMLYNYENKHRTYCKCVGIDGNEYIIRQDALISGATHTIRGACSGGKQHDISGKRFGRLIAIEPINERASNGGVRWKCKCDCGNYIYPTMNNLKRRHTTSCGCAKEDFMESCRLDVIGKKYGKLTVLEDVTTKDDKRRRIRCRCDCGNEHICSVTDLTTGHTMSCGCLNKSKGEIYIEEVLKENGIIFIPQMRFDDCRNIRPLPFDFYLPNNQICIEYDGRQHSESVKFWGGEKRFEDRKINDSIKDEYCKHNNIELIRIPYTMNKDEIYKTIINLTSPATTTVP